MRVEMMGAVTAVAALIFAQTMPATTPSLALLSQLISALGPMGFVMWLVWRTTNHTIPRLAKDFESAMDRERSDFKEALAEQRTDFMRALEREREVFSKMVENIERSHEVQE